MKLKRHGFLTEAELVERTRDWLQADGWACYFEVAPWGSGAARADIVATRGPLLAIVECKLSLSLALLEQCQVWAKYAHVTWAATPFGNRSEFAGVVADAIGAGIVQIASIGSEARVMKRPPLRRRVDDQRIRRHLGQAQADTRPGSTAFATPYTATCDRLRGIVAESGGKVPVKQAMKALQHHYTSDACARATLVKRAESFQVPGIRVQRDGKVIYFEVAS